MFIKKWGLSIVILMTLLRGYAQDAPDHTLDELAEGFEQVWRSSDLREENPTIRSQRQQKKPDSMAIILETAPRIGCVCMDYPQQNRVSTGTCTGHGGVRFWLYQLPSGDTLMVATRRHLKDTGKTKMYKPRSKKYQLDDFTVNALIYSLSVLIGTGAVVLLKKHFWPVDKQTPPPQSDSESNNKTDEDFFI